MSHRPTSQATWFPGYAWQILTCSACGTHVGWRFTEEEGAIAVMSRARYRHSGGSYGQTVRGGGAGGGALDGDSFVGLALEKMRFTRGALTFSWSPGDEAFVAAAAFHKNDSAHLQLQRGNSREDAGEL